MTEFLRYFCCVCQRNQYEPLPILNGHGAKCPYCGSTYDVHVDESLRAAGVQEEAEAAVPQEKPEVEPLTQAEQVEALRNRWPPNEGGHLRLHATLHVFSGSALSDDQKDAVIHRLIDTRDGAQDATMGTVVIQLLRGADRDCAGDSDASPCVQLHIHEWE